MLPDFFLASLVTISFPYNIVKYLLDAALFLISFATRLIVRTLLILN